MSYIEDELRACEEQEREIIAEMDKLSEKLAKVYGRMLELGDRRRAYREAQHAERA